MNQILIDGTLTSVLILGPAELGGSGSDTHEYFSATGTVVPGIYQVGYGLLYPLSSLPAGWAVTLHYGTGGSANKPLIADITLPPSQPQLLGLFVRATQLGNTFLYRDSRKFDISGPAPVAPSGLAVSTNSPITSGATSGHVAGTVSCSPVANATSYVLGVSTAGNTGPWTEYESSSTSPLLVVSAVPSTTVWFRVRGVNNYGGGNLQGANSAVVSWAAPALALPAVPTGLAAIAGDGRVSLSWNTQLDASMGYSVKRKIGAGAYSVVATGVQQTVWVDLGLTNGTTYSYEIAAINGAGTSAYSSPVTATPAAAATPSPDPVTLVRPVGGETYAPGQTLNIQWQWHPSGTGISTPITIEYSALGNFTDTVTIASSVPTSTQQYQWIVPQAATTTGKIRITAAGTPTQTSTSGAFTIAAAVTSAQSITIAAPVGGETFTANTTYTVTWTRGGGPGAVTPVDVYYSTDNFVTLSLIDSNIDGATLSTQWTVPNSNTTNGKIRLVAHGSPQQVSSSGAFTITGAGGGGGAISASIVTPATGASVGGRVKVRAQVDGGTGGVNRVELYVNSALVDTVTAITGAPDFYDLYWDTRPSANGAYLVHVKAYDNAGTPNTVTTSNITLNVSNASSSADEYFYSLPWTPRAGVNIKRLLATCTVQSADDVRLNRLIQCGVRIANSPSTTWSDYTIIPLNRQQDFASTSDTMRVGFRLAKVFSITGWAFTEQIKKIVAYTTGHVLIWTAVNKVYSFDGLVAPSLVIDAAPLLLSGESINDICWFNGKLYFAMSGAAAPLASRLYDYDPAAGQESYTIGTAFGTDPVTALAAGTGGLYIGTAAGRIHLLSSTGVLKLTAGTPTVLPAAVSKLFALALATTNTNPGIAAALADGSVWDLSTDATYGATQIYTAADGTTSITAATLQADPGATNKTRYMVAAGAGNVYVGQPSSAFGLAYTFSFNLAAIAGFANTVYLGGSNNQLWGRTFNPSSNSLDWGPATDALTNVTAITSLYAIGDSLFIGCTGTGNTLWQFQAPSITSDAVLGETISDIAVIVDAFA